MGFGNPAQRNIIFDLQFIGFAIDDKFILWENNSFQYFVS